MSKYNIGDRVIKADYDGKGTIIQVMPFNQRSGRQLYKVRWLNHDTDELEVNLLPDCNTSDPFERCIQGIFGSYSD